jgi:hypothetical protein
MEMLAMYQETEMNEYLELKDFINEKEDYENELMIIRKGDWDKFFNSKDSNREMNILGYLDACNFLEEFGKIIGCSDLDLKECLVNWEYENVHTYGGIKLIDEINGNEEIFIVDVV